MTRAVTDVGPGDYIKVRTGWERIESNTAYGAERTPRDWTIVTEHGTYGMWEIYQYAKAEDMGSERTPNERQ